MCDEHRKKLEYFCLGHEQYYCRSCKPEHGKGTCECIHVRDIYDRLQLDMEERLLDLSGLRERSKRIIDGSFQRNLISRVDDEEKHLDRFYNEMKRKLKEAKTKVKSFNTDEIPQELKAQLNVVVTKCNPVKFSRNDDARDMVQSMKTLKKQIAGVHQLLYNLPNYLELIVDPAFMKLLAYSQDPILIRGRPKYIRAVSDAEPPGEGIGSVFADDAENDSGVVSMEDALSVQYSVDTDGEPVRKKSKSLPGRKRLPNLRTLALVPSLGTRIFPPNKYADKIAAAQQRMNIDNTVSGHVQTPVNGKRFGIKVPQTARSLPDVKEHTQLSFNRISRQSGRFSKPTKFTVRERMEVDECIDAVVLRDCVIMYKDSFLQKRDKKTFSTVIEMKLSKVIGMCIIHGHPSYIAVLQPSKISVLDTFKGLSVLYKLKLKTDTAYREICHVNTVDTGPFHPSFVFAAAYAFYDHTPTQCIELVRARETRRPGKPPIFDCSASEIPLGNQGYQARVVRGIGAFPDGKICIGTPDGIICITETGKLIWKTPTIQEVSGIFCTKNVVYACIQAHKKIVTLNKAGFVTEDNIIPELEILPSRLSANWDLLLVRDYRSRRWISVTFRFGLFVL